VTDYTAHPAAELFPLMGEVELRELADDIKANGQLEPIVVWDNQILDGRNRYAACKLAEVAPRYEFTNGNIGSPVVYVVSKNLHRRHLTVGQRAAIAVDMIPLLKDEAKLRQEASRFGAVEQNSAPPQVHGKVREIAAKAAGVSHFSVDQAAKVKKEDPELYEKVRKGEISVNAAASGHKEQPMVGGQRTTDTNTKRGEQRAGAHKRRMVDGLSVLGGVCHGLESLEIEMVAAVCDPEEIETWATKAESHARELRKFAAKLRGAKNGKSS
jgi:hypothetical protein